MEASQTPNSAARVDVSEVVETASFGAILLCVIAAGLRRGNRHGPVRILFQIQLAIAPDWKDYEPQDIM